MILAYQLPLLILTWLATMLRLGLGELGPAVPSVSLAGVLLLARHSRPGRVRAAAVAAGLVKGLGNPFHWLAAPAGLLLVGSAARATRRLLPLEGFRGRWILGTAWAVVETVIQSAFPGAPGLLRLGPAPVVAAAAGAIGTGLILAIFEPRIMASGRVRHLIERP